MICQTCKAEGQKSIVTPSHGGTTAMYCQPFYDENGVYHHHDSNTTTTGYTCSRGHRWSEVAPKPKCPGCSWPDKAP